MITPRNWVLVFPLYRNLIRIDLADAIFVQFLDHCLTLLRILTLSQLIMFTGS